MKKISICMDLDACLCSVILYTMLLIHYKIE